MCFFKETLNKQPINSVLYCDWLTSHTPTFHIEEKKVRMGKPYTEKALVRQNDMIVRLTNECEAHKDF